MLTQLTPTKGAGARPVLRWKRVTGATLYQVVVLDASGAPHWAWQGNATVVAMGGGTKPAAKGTPTATVGKGFSWTVAAFDDQHKPLALEREAPGRPVVDRDRRSGQILKLGVARHGRDQRELGRRFRRNRAESPPHLDARRPTREDISESW